MLSAPESFSSIGSARISVPVIFFIYLSTLSCITVWGSWLYPSCQQGGDAEGEGRGSRRYLLAADGHLLPADFNRVLAGREQHQGRIHAGGVAIPGHMIVQADLALRRVAETWDGLSVWRVSLAIIFAVVVLRNARQLPSMHANMNLRVQLPIRSRRISQSGYQAHPSPPSVGVVLREEGRVDFRARMAVARCVF